MRIPSSTYRVQFNLNFRFSDAEALVPYLHDLGISDLYASPRFKARKGSSHGYDVADPMLINSELGTEGEFDCLVARLQQYGMGLLLDIVPNHMAASEENPWWMDVLENGRESPYADFFDIDWEPRGIKVDVLNRGRVVVPILSAPYFDVLWKQGIRLRFDDRGFSFQYAEYRLPLNTRDYPDVLQCCIENSAGAGESAGAQINRFQMLSQALTASEASEDASQNRPCKGISEFKATLWRLYQSHDGVRRAIDEGLRIFNDGETSSVLRLHGLLSRQAYRLAHWRLAPYEVNYRRFFDINDLIGLRTEDPLVFAARHSSLMPLLQAGKVSGLRVDHIDGLRDPLEYLERLNAIPIPSGGRPEGDGGVYTVVEKILCGRETLPPEWRVMGTTGYDFLNALNALFIDPQGYSQIEESYRRFAGVSQSFVDEWYRSKREVIDKLFAADLELLVYRLGHIAALDLEGADIPVQQLATGLREITACLPVYRTYYRQDAVLSDHDRTALQQAFCSAQKRAAEDVAGTTFSFLHRVLWAELPIERPEILQAWLNFVMRWQQFTGAVMAKGLEDTALFSHHSLLSLSEVGNNPFHEQILFEPAALHEFNCDASRNRPHTMNATSTHDTKWSEDARARINVLSEMPRKWSKHLRRWSRMNKRHKTIVDGKLVPTANEEVLFYQAMLGIWPSEPFSSVDRQSFESRLESFLIKAAKEAKTHTSWFSPNEKHEDALRKFVSCVLKVPSADPFLVDFLKLYSEVAFFGACNSCSQLVLKITSPGVPDFYQGNELWNLCLTDPDNRQPVDFRSRMAVLERVKAEGKQGDLAWFPELLDAWSDGRLKLYITMCLLNFRRAHLPFFSHASYAPLSARGTYEQSVFAFVRNREDDCLIVVVPRLIRALTHAGEFPLGELWGTTAVNIPCSAHDEWTNLLTGEKANLRCGQEGREALLSTLFRHLPVAVLWGGAWPPEGTPATQKAPVYPPTTES